MRQPVSNDEFFERVASTPGDWKFGNLSSEEVQPGRVVVYSYAMPIGLVDYNGGDNFIVDSGPSATTDRHIGELRGALLRSAYWHGRHRNLFVVHRLIGSGRAPEPDEVYGVAQEKYAEALSRCTPRRRPDNLVRYLMEAWADYRTLSQIAEHFNVPLRDESPDDALPAKVLAIAALERRHDGNDGAATP